MYIYKILNKLNNKAYIGITSNIQGRFVYHKTRYNKTNKKEFVEKPLYRAFRKYGIDNFEFIILFSNISYEEAKQKEVELIAELKTLTHESGYNITKGGAKDAKNSMNQNLALEDKFEEGRKQAQDILDALKEAANKIDAYGKTAKGNIETYTKEKKTGNKTVDANDSVIEKHAASSSKLSTILIEIQAGMQECLTKGMDTGLTLMKAMLSELEYRAKVIDKLEVEKRETAKA